MFTAQIRQLRDIQKNLPVLFEDAFLSLEREIVTINRKQLSKGLLSTGEAISPKYSPSYQAVKGFATPDLYATGGFYKSLFVTRTESFEVFVTSDEVRDGFPLAAHLSSKYSTDIYGIPDRDGSRIRNKAFNIVINRVNHGFRN